MFGHPYMFYLIFNNETLKGLRHTSFVVCLLKQKKIMLQFKTVKALYSRKESIFLFGFSIESHFIISFPFNFFLSIFHSFSFFLPFFHYFIFCSFFHSFFLLYFWFFVFLLLSIFIFLWVYLFWNGDIFLSFSH